MVQRINQVVVNEHLLSKVVHNRLRLLKLKVVQHLGLKIIMNGTNKKILVRTINDICYQSQIAKNAVWLFVYFFKLSAETK
jgi:hypothetical protein